MHSIEKRKIKSLNYLDFFNGNVYVCISIFLIILIVNMYIDNELYLYNVINILPIMDPSSPCDIKLPSLFKKKKKVLLGQK